MLVCLFHCQSLSTMSNISGQSQKEQWVENNFTNIRIFCMDISFSPHGTTLMALLRMSVYGCLLMLDGLVSSHPRKNPMLRVEIRLEFQLGKLKL